MLGLKTNMGGNMDDGNPGRWIGTTMDGQQMRGCLATAFDVARPRFVLFGGRLFDSEITRQLASLQGPRRLASPLSGSLATARLTLFRGRTSCMRPPLLLCALAVAFCACAEPRSLQRLHSRSRKLGSMLAVGAGAAFGTSSVPPSLCASIPADSTAFVSVLTAASASPRGYGSSWNTVMLRNVDNAPLPSCRSSSYRFGGFEGSGWGFLWSAFHTASCARGCRAVMGCISTKISTTTRFPDPRTCCEGNSGSGIF